MPCAGWRSQPPSSVFSCLAPPLSRPGLLPRWTILPGRGSCWWTTFPVASKTNVVRTYHPFQKYANNPVLVADQPWEGLVYLYGTVLPNETRTGYRMWYHTLRTDDANNDGSLELYATSTDGIHWTKPILNLRSWHGSTANNMYFTRPTAGGMTSVMQTPWDPDPAQLYKFMNLRQPGLLGCLVARRHPRHRRAEQSGLHRRQRRRPVLLGPPHPAVSRVCEERLVRLERAQASGRGADHHHQHHELAAGVAHPLAGRL